MEKAALRVRNVSTESEPRAQVHQMRFPITNWNNHHPWDVLTERFSGRSLTETRLQDLGQQCGCHGHTEGNSPVNRRWMQQQKRDATPVPYTTHSHIWGGMGGGLKCKLTGTTFHFSLNTAQMVVKLFPPVILTLFPCSCHTVCFSK